MSDHDPRHDEAAALVAMKETLKTGGHAMSDDEGVEFIVRPIYLGPPQRLSPKALGRKPTRTQYDEAYERRRGLYHRFVRLPESRRKAKVARQKAGEPLLEQLIELTVKFEGTPRRAMAKKIYLHQETNPHLLKCSESNIRKVLKRLDRIKAK